MPTWLALAAVLTTLALSRSTAQETETEHGSIKVLAQKPPLLTVQGLLSAEECQDLIDAAKASPEFNNDPTTPLDEAMQPQHQGLSTPEQRGAAFAQFDFNQDGMLQEGEVAVFLTQGWYLPNHDHRDLLLKIKTVQIGEGLQESSLTLAEFGAFDWAAYVGTLRARQPHLFSRFSKKVWLPSSHPAGRNFQQRIAQAAGLDVEMFAHSEPVLVALYQEKGHYACHYDNAELTAEVFLNDDFEGGEAVFPYADSQDTEDDQWRKEHSQLLRTPSCMANHSAAGPSGPLVVKPVRGNAIIWENAAVPHSFHAGCEVRSGSKWIAIQWASSSDRFRD